MTSPRRPGGGIFASLRFHNYRIWFLSALVANTGTWMQRVAQDWLVLRVLTDDSASATGLTTALQFLPMLLLSAHAGLVADRVDQRKFLILTQSAMGLVSAVLALDVLAGTARLWHVYLAAFLTGVAAAYDAPARQTFVARMVPAEHLSNAVGLNSASFNAARLLGPALAGVVITWVGAGWVFAVNAATFVFPAVALVAMRVSELVDMPRARRAAGQLREGLTYLRGRTDLVVIIAVVAVVSMLTLNFQVTMAAMVRTVFHLESDAYGTVSSVFAVGSLSGALWAARRRNPRPGGVHPPAGHHAHLPDLHGHDDPGGPVRPDPPDQRQPDRADDHRALHARARPEHLHDVLPGVDAARLPAHRLGGRHLGAAHGDRGRWSERRPHRAGRRRLELQALEPVPALLLHPPLPPGRAEVAAATDVAAVPTADPCRRRRRAPTATHRTPLRTA